MGAMGRNEADFGQSLESRQARVRVWKCWTRQGHALESRAEAAEQEVQGCPKGHVDSSLVVFVLRPATRHFSRQDEPAAAEPEQEQQNRAGPLECFVMLPRPG
jgi:hypothetical protein